MITQLPEAVQIILLGCADIKSLKALSLTSKFWRHICLPEVFRKTNVRGTWTTAEAAVETLLQSREICQVVWRFSFIINVKPDIRSGLLGLFRYNKGDKITPRRTFPFELVKLLARMTSLRLLKFSIPEGTVSLFEAAFSTPSVPLRFESIRGLSTDTSCHFLVQYFPELRAVAVDLAARWRHQTTPSETLVRSLVGRPIQFLSLWDCWSTGLTSAIVESMPSIVTLQIFHIGHVELPLMEHLRILRRMKSLKRLEIIGRGGVNFGHHIDMQDEAAKSWVVNTALAACRSLEKLLIQVRFEGQITYGDYPKTGRLATIEEQCNLAPPVRYDEDVTGLNCCREEYSEFE